MDAADSADSSVANRTMKLAVNVSTEPPARGAAARGSFRGRTTGRDISIAALPTIKSSLAHSRVLRPADLTYVKAGARAAAKIASQLHSFFRMEPIAHWHAEHKDFRRLLDVLDREVAIFHDGGQPNYDLMIDIVQYLRHFPDQLHHAREDVAFACLVKKDAGLKTVTEALMREHRVIASAGDTLLGYLEEITGDALLRRKAVESAAAMYVNYYRMHIDREEQEILPRAAQQLTPEDWSLVAAAVPDKVDPLFGKEQAERYRILRREIAALAE
jgi:hemerythrin-like domain-containing protein